MGKKILLINSDLSRNRGDRAIAEGNIELIRSQFPDATITGISQSPKRDAKWFGINFLDMDFQSLSPWQLLRLCRAARSNDIVLWGGGELLKDYTNKASLWYWTVKMTAVRLSNSSLFGMYQGIGPTKSTSSKRLIVYLVNRCKGFIVRDEESYEKLVQWGANEDTLRWASDPAVLPTPQPMSADLRATLSAEFAIDKSFLENFICIGPRDWFHYKQSGILPFAYRKRLFELVGKSYETKSPQYEQYVGQLGKMVREISRKQKTNVLFVPMHMSEGDSALCQTLAAYVNPSQKSAVLDKDILSPADIRATMAKAKTMIGFRLHSTIIAVSAGVPSITLYYVDKGRVFFDQIQQSVYALPIETTLEDGFVTRLDTMVREVVKKQSSIRKSISASTGVLRDQVVTTFQEVMRHE